MQLFNELHYLPILRQDLTLEGLGCCAIMERFGKC